MGYGFDISSITNEALRNLAKRQDFMNENGKLDERSELNIFEQAAKSLGYDKNEETKEEYEKIMGFFRAEKENGTPDKVVADVTDPVDENGNEDKPRDLTKKETKISNKDFKKLITGDEGIMKKKEITTLDKAMETLREKVSTSNNKVYNENLAKMETYYAKAKESDFNSKEDIEALKETLESLKDYDKDLGEYVLGFCEKQQMQKEADEVTQMFLKIPSENYTTRLDELKTQLKEEGKWDKSYYEKAFDYFEENVMPHLISGEIRGTLISVSDESRLEKGERLPDTKDALVEEIKKAHKGNIEGLNEFLTELKTLPNLHNVTQAQYDGLTAKTKIMLGDMKRYKTEGKDTYDLSEFDVELDKLKDKKFNKTIEDNEVFIEVARRRGVVLNRREELKHFTQAQFDELSPKLKLLLEKNNYLKNHTHKDENGEVYYDLSDLSKDVIEYRSGADYRVNIDKESERDSELEWIRKDLKKLFKQDISDDELEEIIELCSYEIYDKDHELTVSKIGKALLNGAATGAVASGVTRAEAEIVVNYDPHDYNIHITNVLTQNIDVNALQSVGITIEEIVRIVTDPTRITVQYAQSLLRCIAQGAIAGAAVGLVMSALHTWLIGDDVGAEKSCVSLSDYDNTKSRYTNYDEFVQYVKDNGDYEKLRNALEKFKPAEGTDPNAKDNWNHAAFFNILRQDAGVGSRMNPEECAGRIYKKVEVPPPPKQDLPPNDPPKPEPLYYDEKITVHDHMNVQKQSWINLSKEKLYDCFVGNSDKENIRMMKIMQGMSQDLLTIEDLEELRDITFRTKGLFKRKSDGTYDIEYTERKLKQAFANFKFPEGYQYNYHQAAVALCSTNMGDSKNEIIAPMTLYHRDGTTCNRKQDIKTAPKCRKRKTTNNRGRVDNTQTTQRATQKGENGPINKNPTPEEYKEYSKKGTKKELL